MSDAVGDDELDDILNGALEAFEKSTEPSLPAPPESTKESDDGSRDEKRSQPTTNENQRDDADRALHEAINSLGQGLFKGDNATDDKVIGDDMKLVEEFMRGLANTLGTGDILQPGAGSEHIGNSSEGDQTRHTAERFVDSIVGSLLSEDVLKKPMMEMSTAYAKWLTENADTLPPADLSRYKEQHELIKRICEKYESGAPSSEIMDLLSKVHGTGEPPSEVIKSLDAQGDDDLSKGQAAELDKLADQCGVQ